MEQALVDAIEEIAARIPVLEADRQYWFIRTNGGLFYDDFLHTGSVGIGYNMVTWAQIRAAFDKQKDAEGGIVKAVLSRYPDFDNNQLGRVVGLFSRFYLDMQPGDVVVMPSSGSNEYAFGIVTDGEPFDVETETTDDKIIYRKRRPVDWILRKSWMSMDSKLYEAFRATQAMTTLNPYASFLDREMHSLYTKDGLTHVRLDITTTDDINGADYFSMGSALLGLTDWFAHGIGLAPAESEVDVRQNIQSPGKLELIVKRASIGAFIAATLTVGLFGGHAKADKFKIDIETKGAFPILLEAYKEHNRQENMQQVLAATLPKMGAEQGEDMLRIVAGQAPVPDKMTAESVAEPPTTAASSAAAAAAATASIAKPAASSTLADSTAEAPPPPTPKTQKKE